MKKKEIVYFADQSYKDNRITIEVLRLALERARDLKIKRVVIPSSSGETALRAVEVFKGSNIELIVVSDRAGVTFSRREYENYSKRVLPAGKIEEFLNVAGFKEKEEIKAGLSWNPDVLMKLRQKNVKVVVASEPFRTMLRSRVNPTYVVGETLTLFGRGVKVAVEVVLAACDAGFLEAGEEVIALGGLTKGVDAALVVRACHRDEMFLGADTGLQIREIICKPSLR